MSWSTKLKATGAVSVMMLLTSGVFAQSNMADPAWDDDASAQEMFDSELDEVQQQEAQDKSIGDGSESSDYDESIFSVEEETPEENVESDDTLEVDDVTDPMSEEAIDVYEEAVPVEPTEEVNIEVEPVDDVNLAPDTIEGRMLEDKPDVLDLPPELQPQYEQSDDLQVNDAAE